MGGWTDGDVISRRRPVYIRKLTPSVGGAYHHRERAAWNGFAPIALPLAATAARRCVYKHRAFDIGVSVVAWTGGNSIQCYTALTLIRYGASDPRG